MNVGKKFEQDYKNSVPEYALLCRMSDAAQSFGGTSSKLRFSNKSPFDYIMWDSQNCILFALELKTKQGDSISFERTEDDKNRDIHYHQVKNLNLWAKYNVESGLIINFRDRETTIYLPIKEYNRIIELVDKVSFNYSDLIENNINYLIIPQELKRTRYTYDVDWFIQRIREKRRK